MVEKRCSDCSERTHGKWRCIQCEGKKRIPSPCSICDGVQNTMALDIPKLCSVQSLCVKCGIHFPNDKIMYWSGCNHDYCMDCMRSEIRIQNDDQKRIPICLSNGCECKLSCKRLNSIPGMTRHRYCFGCNHYVENYMKTGFISWPKCSHKLCKQCAEGHIHGELHKERIPICLKNGCYSKLTESGLKIMKLWEPSAWNHYMIVNRRSDREWEALAILRRLIYRRDHYAICVRCSKEEGEEIMFCWTVCNHWYCVQCAFQIINRSLSMLNQIPKCIHSANGYCNQQLQPLDAQSIIVEKRESLLSKYNKSRGDMHILSNYNQMELMVTGFIWIHFQSECFSVDIVQVIFNYFKLIHYTKTQCTKPRCGFCISRSGEYMDCDQCNGRRYANAQCNQCKGRKRIPFACTMCKYTKFTMSLDFEKVCNQQSLCIKCGLYFPNDMIIYWSGCNHVYCMDCIRSEIAAQNDTQKRIPICVSDGCESTLSLERLRSIPGMCSRAYCYGCKCYVEKDSIMKTWSICSHSLCNQCANCHASLGLKSSKWCRDSEAAHFVQTLETIVSRNAKYQCVYCQQWHLERERTKWEGKCSNEFAFCIECANRCGSKHPVKKTSLIRWSCNHWYCADCAIPVINESLSTTNQIPQCSEPQCNGVLENANAESILSATRPSLLPKYKRTRGDMHIVSNYNLADLMMAGYIRIQSRWNHLLVDVTLTVFDYLHLFFYSKIECQVCQFNAKEYVDCIGAGQVKKPCSHCTGNKAIMAFDFKELCSKQSLCIKCCLYFPNDMIIYWSVCNHVYCVDCIRSEIKTQNDTQKRIPICVVDGCECSLSCERLNSIPEVRHHGYCLGCTHYEEDRYIKSWPIGSHTLCNGCAVHHIRSELKTERIPVCLKGGCDSELTESTMKSMKLWGYMDSLTILRKLIHRRDTYAICVRCDKEQEKKNMFCWTVCNHWYCMQCTFQIINDSLSMLNQIPKCIHSANGDCNQQLQPLDAQSIIVLKRESFLPKYSKRRGDMHILFNYNQAEVMVTGYVRSNFHYDTFPVEIVQLIFNYIKLIHYTKIQCQFCALRDDAHMDCTLCNGKGYERKFNGYSMSNVRCDQCKGRKQIPSACSNCKDTKLMMALDFQKVCNEQSLCIKCGLYFPNDVIIYWSGCNHVYCMDCIRSKISTQNDIQKRAPICSGVRPAGCLHKLSLQRINSIPKVNYRGYCHGCNHYVNHSIIRWSSCHHTYCIHCVIAFIKSDLDIDDRKDKIPRCRVSGCNQGLTIEKFLSLRTQSKNPKGELYLLKEIEEKLRRCWFRNTHYFQCRYCNDMHPVEEKLKWTERCAKVYGYCTICKRMTLLMQWSSCGHSCCRVCAIRRCDKLLRIGQIPRCLADGCFSELTVKTINAEKLEFAMKHKLCELWRSKLNYACTYCKQWHPHKEESTWSKRCAEAYGYCSACKQYLLRDQLMQWSSCGHSCCKQCAITHCNNDLRSGRIPKCLTAGCSAELMMETMQSNKLYIAMYPKLRLLWERKTQYKCVLCKTWHQKEDQEQWNVQCAEAYHRCLRCSEYKKTEELFRWTGCEHEYCLECIRSEINTQNHDQKRIPVCFSGGCPCVLSSELINSIPGVAACRYCIGCKHYVDIKEIISWSTCHHSICNECAVNHIRNELNDRRFPVCLDDECDSELTVKAWRNLLNTTYAQKSQNIYRIVCKEGLDNRLSSLITGKEMRSKGKFKCSSCSQWHDDLERVIWSKQCSSEHEYGKHCMLKIIDDAIPKGKPLTTAFSGFSPAIPRCVNESAGEQCGCALFSSKVQLVGATEYQIQILRKSEVGPHGRHNGCLLM